MKSFREQLKSGTFNQSSSSIKTKIHKFIGDFTISEEGYCEFDLGEHENYFLLKHSRNHSKKCKGVMR